MQGTRWLHGSGEKHKMLFLNKSRGAYYLLWVWLLLPYSVETYPLLCCPPSPAHRLTRVLPLSVYIWYRESHQPVQHQWCSGSPCCPHQHHPEGPAVRRGWSQHQWGGKQTIWQNLSLLSSPLSPLPSSLTGYSSPATGRHIIWRAAHWVSVLDWRCDAGRCSDEAAGLPGQDGPATGHRFSTVIGHRRHHRRQRQERREHCQRGGERSPCLS